VLASGPPSAKFCTPWIKPVVTLLVLTEELLRTFSFGHHSRQSSE